MLAGLGWPLLGYAGLVVHCVGSFHEPLAGLSHDAVIVAQAWDSNIRPPTAAASTHRKRSAFLFEVNMIYPLPISRG